MEVLVAAGLSLMILGLLLSVLVPTFRQLHQGSAQVELQQGALHSFRAMIKDLRETTPGALTVTPDGQALALIRVVNWTQSGQKVYDTSAQVYFQAGGALFFKTLPLPAPTTVPPQVTVAELQTAITQNNGSERYLCGDVEFFAVGLAPPGAPLPAANAMVSLELRLERKTAHTERRERFHLQRTVVLRNGV